MEDTAGLASVVAEAVSLFEELVLAQATLWGEGDLLTMERQLQQVLRQVGNVLAARARGPDPSAHGDARGFLHAKGQGYTLICDLPPRRGRRSMAAPVAM